MEHVELYRFEHPGSNFGPYSSYGWLEDASEELHDQLRAMKVLHQGDDWPCWREDGMVFLDEEGCEDWDFQDEHYAACESVESLFAWFDGFVPTLFALGFQLVKVTVDADSVLYGASGKQVAYWNEAEVSRETLDMPVLERV